MINGTPVMWLRNYAPVIDFLPTRDNRFVLVLPAYPAQQVKAAELLRCGMVYDQMAQAARSWDAAGQEAALPISMVRSESEFRPPTSSRATRRRRWFTSRRSATALSSRCRPASGS